MQSETVTIGELTCRVFRPDDTMRPEGVVVLCHGFGAPGDDLVSLAGEYLRSHPGLNDRVLFVFPEGPLSIPEVPGGRAWWHIDMFDLQSAIVEGQFRDLRQSSPPQLPESRQQLTTVLELLQEETGLPLSRFVLGGFSQGSMLATDVTLRLENPPGALIIYSGTLLAEPEWTELAPRRKGLRVLQTHGTYDPLLPLEAAIWLRDLLTDAGLQVNFQSFAGMHTIPREAVPASAQLIEDVISSPL